jgi:hypothetical protein
LDLQKLGRVNLGVLHYDHHPHGHRNLIKAIIKEYGVESILADISMGKEELSVVLGY